MSENIEIKKSNEEVYLVIFEDYLKPKKSYKTRKLQLFDDCNVKQKTHSNLPMPGKKATNLKVKNANFQEKIKLKNFNFKPVDLLWRLLPFLRPRRDKGVCKRKSGFEIYCELSSVHGFVNFIHANLWQRLFWTFIICLAVCLCCVVVRMSHFRYERQPTVFYTEGITYPSWIVPIPALTFCNLNRISKTEAEKLANKFSNQSFFSRQKILRLFPLAHYASHEVNGTRTDFDALEMLLRRTNYTIDRLVYELSPKCGPNEYLYCKAQGRVEHCEREFKEALTVTGVCCRRRSGFKRVYTRKIGFEGGLKLLLDPNVDDYTFSAHKFFGYTMYVHDVYEGADGLVPGYIVQAYTETFFGIIPRSTYGTQYLRAKDIQTRQCYFPDERKLVTFEKYSQTTCLMECRSLLIFEKCGCLPTFWPKLSEKWHYCQRAVEIKCVLDNKDIFSQTTNDSTSRHPKIRQKIDFICNCLPSCETNNYAGSIESAALDTNFTIAEKHIFLDASKADKRILFHAFYVDLISERYRLDVSENWLSFMGTFGGIAGLYTGFSIVSGFEVIFFAFVRPACNWLTKKQIQYRLRKRQISANQQKEEN